MCFLRPLDNARLSFLAATAALSDLSRFLGPPHRTAADLIVVDQGVVSEVLIDRVGLRQVLDVFPWEDVVIVQFLYSHHESHLIMAFSKVGRVIPNDKGDDCPFLYVR